MLKKLLWKIRFARRINRYSKSGLAFGWYCAGAAVESWPEWFEESPEDMADDEMSYWDNDE